MTRAALLSAIFVMTASCLASAQTKRAESTRKKTRDAEHMVLVTASHPLVLLRVADVRKELKITPEQEAVLQKCWDKRARFNDETQKAITKEYGEDPDPQTFDALRAQLVPRRREFERQLDLEVLKALDTPQRIRFDQVALQFEGQWAFRRPEFQARLNMSPGQIEAIEAILMQPNPVTKDAGQAGARYRELAAQIQDRQPKGDLEALRKSEPKLVADYEAARQQNRKALDRVRERAMQEIYKLLRKKQIETYEALCGERFEPAWDSSASSTEKTGDPRPR
jgi:hypothetical protein